MKDVVMYTDGGCIRNPHGPGGYGVVLLYSNGNNEYKKELKGGYKNTTNNRMELTAVIEGLKALKESCNVVIHSDSKYIVDAINLKWVYKWQSFGWYKNAKGKERPKNIDLWKQIIDLVDKHKTTFKWVKGHAGNLYNERCDELANIAMKMDNLIEDKGYEE